MANDLKCKTCGHNETAHEMEDWSGIKTCGKFKLSKKDKKKEERLIESTKSVGIFKI